MDDLSFTLAALKQQREAEILGAYEASLMLGYSVRTVQSRCRTRRIAAAKICGQWVIRIQELYPILNDQKYREVVLTLAVLREKYSLWRIGDGLDMLDMLERYECALQEHRQGGVAEGEARVRAGDAVNMCAYDIERIGNEYAESGLAGVMDFREAENIMLMPSTCDHGAKRLAAQWGSRFPIVAVCKGQEREPLSIVWFLKHLEAYTDEMLEAGRKRIEEGEAGMVAIQSNPNRRLYAVLKPTRAENIERIKHVFLAMDAFELYKELQSVRIQMDWLAADRYQ